MKYFIDTEFIERGHKHPLDLISIAVVAEDGREFYAISTEFNPRHASDWVRSNVFPLLPDRDVTYYDSPRRQMEAAAWKKRDAICDDLIAFIGDDTPEFWGWCCDFDYVLVSQLIGFEKWPSSWPYYFRDIQQAIDETGADISEVQRTGNHHALDDAREICRIWHYLQESAEET